MVLGCLPMFIQMPFLIGFYYAIRRTPEISEQSFLWFSLGETNISMALIAIVVYYIQARVSLIGLDQKQQGPMAAFVYISPIMIGIISFVMPAALRSEEHTSELQSRGHLVCRLLLEKKKLYTTLS